MPLHIHKLGGASLADTAAIRHAVEILSSRPRPIVVVVSAMAGVTDILLDAARQAATGNEAALVTAANDLQARHLAACNALVPAGPARHALREAITRSFTELQSFAHGLAILRELTTKTTDYVVARGERLSARLMAGALQAAGVDADYVDAVDVIACDEHFGSASPELALTDRTARKVLGPMIRRGVVPVVPGFIGRTPEGHVATLGRGGSDLSATLLARALGASDVTLWKDVPGLLTADPRIVPDARVIPQLTPREAAELAYYGAKVLHPRALIPLGDRRIPVRVRPFGDPEATGSEVSPRRTLRRYPVKALSSIGQQALVTVSGNGMLGVPGIAARTFAAMHDAGVSVSLISQASSEHSICFSVPQASAGVARVALERAFANEFRHREVDGIEVESGMTTIAVVGMGMAGTPGIAARVFESLAAGGINLVAIAQGSSELNISFVVRDRDAVAAVRRVHGAFQLNRLGGGAVTRPEVSDVILLGFGQIGRALARMIPRAKTRGVRLRIVGVIDRSGHVFDPAGLTPRALTDLVRRKEMTGRVAPANAPRLGDGAANAVQEMARHALSHPILVDVTADDTVATQRFALEAGMDVVTANKRPLGGPIGDARLLLDTADAHGRRLLHETTVGAGLPIIDTLHKLLESGDTIHRIEGCTSGTLGYVFTELQHGRRFSDVVRKAMQLGYTEPDPRDDFSGMDVARKALILARLLGFRGDLGDVRVQPLLPDEALAWSRDEFVRRLGELDEAWAARVHEATTAGLVLRYVATATRRKVTVDLRAVPSTSPFAGLRGTDNQVVFTTTRYRDNPMIITGPGAGPAVTAAGVLNDILKAAG
ncbi:MAG: bifunctional aspartate kinase/homoserine dehydrogenase I [Gemmatimonadaceae bacterium]|nr:bifunctional aspartate kinase/homoserine dehydrogenase I [Gemmatimonadaceae bacterium]